VASPTAAKGIARLTVFFEKAGKRKLVAKFANLKML
jgi:hypothetical protein